MAIKHAAWDCFYRGPIAGHYDVTVKSTLDILGRSDLQLQRGPQALAATLRRTPSELLLLFPLTCPSRYLCCELQDFESITLVSDTMELDAHLKVYGSS